LRAYLLAKLLWDPQTDLQRATTEFLNAYYGQAAPQLRQYLDLLEQQVRGGKSHAHIFDSSKVPYLNDEFLAGSAKIFDAAEQATADETVRLRVQVARLPVDYVQLATQRVPDADKATLLKHFLEIAHKAGISNVSESGSLDAWAKKMSGE